MCITPRYLTNKEQSSREKRREERRKEKGREEARKSEGRRIELVEVSDVVES